MKNFDLIVIGSGPTGLYAGYLGSLQNLNVLILEASQDLGGQMKLFKDKPVYDLPGHININGFDIMNALSKQVKKKNITIKFNEEVVKITGKFNEFKIITNRNNFYSKTIIVATGGGLFKPAPLGIKFEENFNNISYHIEDVKKYLGKKLVIFGGGDTAIDWAHFFINNNSKVSLIHRRDQFRGNESMIEEIKDKANVYSSYILSSVFGNKKINKILITNKKTKEQVTIDCDEVLVFYGQQKVKNDNKIFKMNQDLGGFIVESNMETSTKGIFAIGNVASYKGKVKIMSTGLGEAATAIGSIVEYIYPGKKMTYYTKKKDS